MNPINILMDISTEMITGVIIFILGFIGAKVPYSFEKYKLSRFFGNALFTDDCVIIYGALTRTPSEAGKPAEKLYEKKYHDGRIRKIPLFKKIISNESMRSTAYLIQRFARFRKKPFPVLADEEAFQNLNRTFICLGSPITNELTEWAINEPSNQFLKFSIPEILYNKPITIDVISHSNKNLSFESTEGKDYGMILKIRNSRFPTRFFFVCAGIRTWGTSGAAWYLSEHWKSLYKEFGDQEFGVVLEVNRTIVTSAVRVHP